MGAAVILIEQKMPTLQRGFSASSAGHRQGMRDRWAVERTCGPGRGLDGASGYCPLLGLAVLGLLIVPCLGCYYSMRNHPLDPSQVGVFSQERTIDIRTTLGIQDTPPGVPGASDPRPEDLERSTGEYRFSSGDTVLIRIFELLAPGTESPIQGRIDERGEVSLPVLGRVPIEGLTPPELEAELRDILAQREILVDAQVVVEPLVRRKWTFSLFGAIGGPNLYPLPSPDFRILEALNAAGGLVDGATHVYVFRKPPARPSPAGGPPGIPKLQPMEAAEPPPDSLDQEPVDSSEANRIDAGAEDLSDDRDEEAARGVDLGLVFPNPLLNQPAEPDPPVGEVKRIRRAGGPEDPPPTAAGGGEDSPARTAETGVPQPKAAAVQPEDLDPTGPGPGWLFLNQQGWVPDPSLMTREADSQRGPDQAPARRLFPGDAEPVVDWERIAGEPAELRIIELSADALRNGDPGDNIVIRPGDVIRVYAGVPGEYFMMGHVRRPGAYSLTGRQVTLIQAVAAAGGFTPLAWPERCTVYRRIGDRRELKQVNLDHIFAGHEPDVFLKKDDVILVGSHPSAPFLAVIRNAFRVTYGFGFVYDRNFADVDAFVPRQNPETVARFAPTFPGLFQ